MGQDMQEESGYIKINKYNDENNKDCENISSMPRVKDNQNCLEKEKKKNLYFHYIGGYNLTFQEGFGIMKWSDGSIFKGIFHEGLPFGWGIFQPSNKIKYQGYYENDKPNGYGIYEIIDDSLYEGYWTNEEQNGYGIEQWKDGSIYEGEFSLGKKNGIGKYTFPKNNEGNEKIYYGEWERNLMNGWGLYYYTNGGEPQIYAGEWVNGLREGYGEVYGKGHNYLFGYFKGNNPNGFFVFFNSKSGKIIIGYHINGKIEGFVKIFRENKEGSFLVIKNGHKILEIEGEEEIENYINDENNLKKFEIVEKKFNIYFLMKRKNLERRLNAQSLLQEKKNLFELLGRIDYIDDNQLK